MQSIETLTDGSLRVMPIHNISEVYGEAGLYARFDLELQRFDSEERLMLKSARDLALELHGQDRRGRDPYNNHILRSSIRVVSPYHYDVADPEIVAGTLLHDSVEDHAEELSHLGDYTHDDVVQAALDTIATRFGQGTAEIVGAVSNPKFDKQGDWKREYCEHVEERMLEFPRARPTKLTDFGDNGGGILYARPDRLQHFADKYMPLVEVFRRIVPLSDTPLSPKVKAYILGQLDLTEQRFRAILQ